MDTILKRILFVLNKPNRELPIMNAVRREIAILAPETLTKVIHRDPQFMDEVLAFRPNVVMTYPMTGVGLAEPYYVFRQLFGTRVFCFRTEGIVDLNSSQSVANHVGFDRYGPGLIDGEIFWGPAPARLIGEALVASRKLTSTSHVQCFGYPRLERYFGITPPEGWALLPKPLLEKLDRHGKERTILLATGFHFANYTRQMIFAAKDLDAERRCDELLGIIEEVKRFRASWIEQTLRAAKEHPDLLFVLKKHPIERPEDYRALEGIENIEYVWQDVDIGNLIEHASIFFHYGSTSLVDAYLSRVPAVYVYSREPRCRQWFPDMGWPSASMSPSDGICSVVTDFRKGLIRYDAADKGIKAVLEANFNIREGEPYRPSRKIAEYLLQDHPPQRIALLDRHRIRALAWHNARKLWRRMPSPVRRALRALKTRFQE